MARRKSTIYRNGASHSLSLESGQMAAPGAKVTFLGEPTDHDQALIDEGALTESQLVADEQPLEVSYATDEPLDEPADEAGGDADSATVSDVDGDESTAGGNE